MVEIKKIPRLRANKVIAYDLHVLGMPPAFILSQDQTLIHNCAKSSSSRISLEVYRAHMEDKAHVRHVLLERYEIKRVVSSKLSSN